MDKPPQFQIGELVRSRIDPDASGSEEVRTDLEVEAGERQKDPVTAD